ncbi:hypothetical protein ANN_00999 [Periplaneta americana]|uniref:Tc1-like transposase DDE domain-containing protein n=1 Tax=Periplaneta americana TaxID=6978 RepID=A0ABQ8TUS4_PERAM|nr:hypothetical protein ANN_00999 [Periplaneta americana]
MQDNQFAHTAINIPRQFAGRPETEFIPWPPKTPDLNVIEHVRAEMKKRRIDQYPDHPPQNPDQLWDQVLATWQNLAEDQNYFRDLVDSMPRRCQTVVDAAPVACGQSTRRTGGELNRKSSGRPLTSDDTVQNSREAVEKSPRTSIRRLSRELNILRINVWRTLRFTLKKKAYNIQVMHHLEEEDYAILMEVRANFLDTAENENGFTWGHIKSLVYKAKITSSHHLSERIMEAVNSITPDQLQRVFTAMEKR